ncbi:MFS transporter [Arthrobacter sp. GCM10027362]|uniref:MFS transporter n=1 Tax=Arthrobacter sp. GCM10027362 TaxID=3273379 RepID=UPI00366CDB72
MKSSFRRERAGYRWLTLVTVSLGLMLIALDNSVLYTALPTLTAELGATPSDTLWIINAYPLVMAGFLLGAGTLGDRIGHRRMFLVGITVFGAASLLAAFAPTSGILIASRGLLALGAAAMMPATLALIRLTFTDDRERSVAVATWSSTALIAAAFGPMVGGVLLEHFWWGSVFLINVPIVLIAIGLASAVAPHDEPNPHSRWNAISSLQATAALAGLVFAIKSSAAADPVSASCAACVAAIAGWLFVRRQRVMEHPLLDLQLFRQPQFASGVVAALITMFIMAGLQLLITQRYQLADGYSPLQAGLLVSAIALGALPASFLASALAHRQPVRRLLIGGFTAVLVGLLVVLLSPPTLVPAVAAALLLAGFGVGLTMTIASLSIINGAPPHRAGMASAIEEVSYELGALLAVALLGSLLAAFRSTGPVGRDNISGLVAGYSWLLALTWIITASTMVLLARILRGKTADSPASEKSPTSA